MPQVIETSEKKISTNYIQFVHFRDMLDIWVSNSSSSSKSYSDKYPLIKIGDILIRSKLTTKIQDENKYNRVTIKLYGKGVSIRDTVMGKEIGTKNQSTIKKGQFIISKIDARNGAFGVVPSECDGAIATNDFPSFDVDHTRITPEFLNLITTTKEFQSICELASTGTTGRRRVDMKKFEEMAIPLPDIDTQKRIVSAYYAKIDEANRLDALVIEKEKEIENYLMETLGITIENVEKKIGLNFVRFKELKVWNLERILEENSIDSTKYNLASFEEISNKISDGTHQTPTYTDKENGVMFLSSKDVTSREINWDNVKYIPRTLHNEISKSFKPIIGDIFLAKNGTTGVAAMLEIEKEFSIYVSLAYISPKRDLVNPLYFLYYINSRFAKIQFNKNLVGVGVPNLHLSKIRETKIPLPSLEVQLEIVDHIQSLNSKISYTKELSKSLKQEAKEEYENELFA